MTLQEQRKDWEQDLVVVAEKQQDEGTFLVILRQWSYTAVESLDDGMGQYSCHRYFTVGGNWEVSVDASNVDAETAMKWAWSPKALSRELA